jgi:hypothetical protein
MFNGGQNPALAGLGLGMIIALSLSLSLSLSLCFLLHSKKSRGCRARVQLRPAHGFFMPWSWRHRPWPGNPEIPGKYNGVSRGKETSCFV